MSLRERKTMQIGSRVPLEALDLAARILEGGPGPLPRLRRPKAARDALAYVQAMDAVAGELREALGRVERSAARRRKAAADVTLSLYAMLKGLVRLGLLAAARTVQVEAAPAAPRRPPALPKRSWKVTKKEIEEGVKAIKATKKSDVGSEKGGEKSALRSPSLWPSAIFAMAKTK